MSAPGGGGDGPPHEAAVPAPAEARAAGALYGLAAVMGIAELGFATNIPLLPLYLKEQLGASAALVGIVVATFAGIETVCKTLWGGVADRIGRRPVVVGGLLVSSLAPLLMAVLRVPLLFVPLRLVDGTGSAAVWPSIAASIVDRTRRVRRAAAMGTLNMFFLSGLALGPSLGLYVAGALRDYRAGFYLASALLLSAAVLASRVLGVRAPGAGGDAGLRPGAGRYRALVRSVAASPRFGAMLAVAFLQTFGIGLLAPILPIYAHEIVGLSDQALGLVFLGIVLAVAAASIPGGRLADRVGKPRIVAWGMGIASAGMWLLPLAGRGNFIVLGAAATMLGASYALSAPAWLALVSEAAPAAATATVMGVSETAQGAGFVVGPALGGLLYDRLGPHAPFVGSAVLLTLGAALAVSVVRRQTGRPGPVR